MDRRIRVGIQVAVLVVLLAALGFQAATAESTYSGAVRAGEGAYPGETLITVQSYGWFSYDNGEAFVVNESGDVVWTFDPPNSRVFDAEEVEGGNILASVATRRPASECPPEHLQRTDDCVENRVVELDRDTGEIVWNYTWYDEFISEHEVHDADRLPSGETAIVDMGNERAFTVDRDGEITWAWSAVEHLGPGSEFWAEHVPEERRDEYRREGPESDWTHVNDIDRLEDGTIQLSIRNFDVVIAVDPNTNEIVDVVGSPGNRDLMYEQHNPNRIEHDDTMLVADSENDRIVEIDLETEEVIWTFRGSDQQLAWPRDADRLPNGNTLVVDSRNFRVLEVNETGTVVWEYSLEGDRGIVYDADRLSVPEEPEAVPSARSFNASAGPVGGALDSAVTWARFVLPLWVGVPELLAVVGAAVVALGLLVESGLYVRARWR
jgi:outer membrane protein assembly factor BamB